MKTACGCLFSAVFTLLLLAGIVIGCYFLRRAIFSNNPQLDSIDPAERIDAARKAANQYGEKK